MKSQWPSGQQQTVCYDQRKHLGSSAWKFHENFTGLHRAGNSPTATEGGPLHFSAGHGNLGREGKECPNISLVGGFRLMLASDGR